MYLNSILKHYLWLFYPAVFIAVSCNPHAKEVDLLNNEAHRHQAYTQILENPELQQELFGMLLEDEESMKQMMRNQQFTGELFKTENLNYIWDNNPAIDSAVVDNVTTRMHTDTNFMKLIDDRMESGTPTGTR